MRRPVIGVMGPGENADRQAVAWARQLGALVAGRGWVLLNGGRDVGVMDAACAGAREAGGLVVGVLPGSDAAGASDHVDVAVVTGMGSARNNINVLSSDVVVACGNLEAGTLSEVTLALKADKPVVLLTGDDDARRYLERVGRGAVLLADDPAGAVAILGSLPAVAGR